MCIRGERIKISLKAGLYRPASDMPLPLNAGLVSRGSGPVLLKKTIFL